MIIGCKSELRLYKTMQHCTENGIRGIQIATQTCRQQTKSFSVSYKMKS